MFSSNQKRIAPLIIIFIIIGILVVGGAAYYFLVFQKTGTVNNNLNANGAVNLNNSELTNQNVNKTQISGWKTYENTKYQYQIKYPMDWPMEVDGTQVWENSVSNPELGNTAAFFNTNTEPDGQVGMVVITISAVENPKKLSPRDFFMEILKNPIDTLGTDLDPLLRYNLEDTTFKDLPALQINDQLHRDDSRWSMVARESIIYDISLSVDNFSKREFHIPPERIFQEMFDSLTFTAPISPNSPSYIELSSCPEMSQYVINANGFPKEFIHLCSDTKYGNILGGPYYIVEIKYGQAQDCPAGCFYDSFIGAVKESDQTTIELPPKDKNYLLTTVVLPNQDFKKRDFKCDADLDDITTMKFAVWNNTIGWELNFTKSLTCSWKEIKTTKVTVNNTLIHTADEVAWRWAGPMFVSLKGKDYQWDYSGLISGEVSRNEVILEDHL